MAKKIDLESLVEKSDKDVELYLEEVRVEDFKKDVLTLVDHIRQQKKVTDNG